MAGALIGTVVFALVERRHRAPLLDFKLFRERSFSAASIVYFLNNFAGMGVGFAVIVFLQKVLAYSPPQPGLLLLPATIGRGLAELITGHLADRWGVRGLSLAGLFVFATACAALSHIERPSGAFWVGALLIFGSIGMALSNSPILYAGLRGLHDERISMGSGILSLVRIIGGTFGVGVVGPLVALGERWGSGPAVEDLPRTLAQATLPAGGYQVYFGLTALILLATMLPACLVRPRPRMPCGGCLSGDRRL
jgi:MFS family permease